MKIFVYGCSFTKYSWPSYADIIGLNYNVINQGASGSSNERIFYTFMNDIKNNLITDSDIVILQWSGTNRFNYLKPNGEWIGDGNVTLPHNKYIFNKIKGWYNIDFEYDKDVNLILAAKAILNNLGIKFIEMSMNPIHPYDNDFLENDLAGTYPGDYTFTEFRWKTFPSAVYVDWHPTIIQHNDIAQRILNHLNLSIFNNSKIIKKLHKQIQNTSNFDIKYSF